MSLRFTEDFRRSDDVIFKQCCDGIESFARVIKDQALPITEISISTVFVDVDRQRHPYEYLGAFYRFIHATYLEKFQELVNEFISAVNAKHYLTAALCGRSIIESTATLRFYNNAVMKSASDSSARDIGDVDPQFISDALTLAKQHMHGSTINWSAFFTQSKKTFVEDLVEREKRRIRREPKKKEDFVQASSIGKQLDSWFEEDPELVALAYNFFSELVHPNLGSNLLIIGISGDRVQVGYESNRAAGKSVLREAVKFLTPCLREASTQLARSILISSLGNRIDSNPSMH